MITKVWAHRGASGYAPENTMPAFELAVEMGADAIEIDIHMTEDGEIVICHDDVLDRVSNGSGPIYQKTLAELKEYDFNNGLEGYSNVKISTLKEFYTFSRDNSLFVNTEIKYSGDSTKWEEINEKVVKIATECKMTDYLLYSSFKFEPLIKLKKLDAKIKVGLLFKKGLDNPCEYAKIIGADALHPKYNLVKELKLDKKCKENKLLLHPWTVNDPKDIKQMIQMGVNAIITNYPDKALI